MSDEIEIVMAVPNAYEFKLVIMKNEVINVSITSSNTSSSWTRMISFTLVGALIIAGLFGKDFVELYHLLVG